jgi:hypothetical protein
MVVRGRRLALVAALLSVGVGSSACKKGSDAQPPPTAEAEPGDDGDDDDDEGELEDPEESPYLDFSNFNDRVDEHISEIVACYQETAAKDPDAPDGRVKTTFVLNGDGKVTEIKFDEQRSTLFHPALNECIDKVASEWTFNISLTGGDTTMPYTFDLEPGGLLP